jgi:DNA polymerase III alpha subunit
LISKVFFKNLCPWTKSEDVFRTESGVWVYVLGLLSCRQKPPTAGGLCFLTLEDELGFMNLVLMPEVYEQYRLLFDSSMLLGAFARVERSIQRDMRDPHTAAVSLKVQKLWNPFLGVRPFCAPAQRQALDNQTAQAEVAVQAPNFKRPWGLGAG